jgi:hypothetical protein
MGIIVRSYSYTPEQLFENFYDWSMKHGYADNLTIDRT